MVPSHVTTQQTHDRLTYRQATEGACTVYETFTKNVDYVESLAKLALFYLPNHPYPTPELSTRDLSFVEVKGFVTVRKNKPVIKTITGIVAVNMVSVDFYDGVDFEVSMREPFVEIPVIERIFSGELKSNAN